MQPGTIPLRAADIEIGPDRDIRRAHIELDLAAIATGNTKRNIDLAKPRFLDTTRCPTMLVDLLPVGQGDSGWRTDAILAIRGVQAPMEVAIELQKSAADDVARVIVIGTLDRVDVECCAGDRPGDSMLATADDEC
ncbi:MAG: YceI family protein [Nakamurella sp.]